MNEPTLEEHKEFVLRVYESIIPGKLEVSVEFPDDMDYDNLRPCESLGITLLEFISTASEEFERVADN